MLPKELLESAVEFHGHLGPFLVLGLRAGLLGVRHLGKSYFELKATVETDTRPPRSCFIDGIQFASGCTTGKCNLEARDSRNVSVEFVRGERSIRVIVKDNVLRVLDQLDSEEQIKQLSKELLKKADDELFSIRTD